MELHHRVTHDRIDFTLLKQSPAYLLAEIQVRHPVFLAGEVLERCVENPRFHTKCLRL